MAYNETLAERMRQRLEGKAGVEEKKMFGGIGFLLNGNMLVGVWKDSMIVRISSDDGATALLKPHVMEFDITGKPMKGWILVAPQGVEDDEELTSWINVAWKFVMTQPAKKGSAKKISKAGKKGRSKSRGQ